MALRNAKRALSTVVGLVCLFAAFAVFARPSSAEFDESLIASQCALLIEAKTGNVLYQKNAGVKAWPASTTKILTALVVLDQADLNATITVGRERNRFTSQSSLMGLVVGEKVTVRDALYGMLIVSGNDAAASLAIHVAGSEDAFVDKMNAKAAEIGMKDSHFTNPHGVHNEDHYTTAADLGKLAVYAMKNADFAKIVALDTFMTPATNKNKERELLNSNKLLSRDPENAAYYYPYATGIKTGLTEKYANGCLVASAKKGDVELIAVILNDATKGYNKRWTEAKDLFEYGFANCASLSLKDLNLTQKLTATVTNASLDDPEGGVLELIPRIEDQSISLISEDLQRIRNDSSLIEVVVTTDKQPLEAPIQKGEVVGTAAYRFNGETLVVVQLEAGRDVLVADNIDSPQPTVNNLISDTATPKNPGIAQPMLYALLGVLLILAVLCVIRIMQIRKKRRSRSHASRRRSQRFYTYRERR